ncbi:MAG: L-seryl-tRNA(Sec) selenium transferase [Proteobacteria bacterium]|nr:L-seryl-tRNA(Sec) selenium transferase [Pseudomonadota bacterium]
MATKSRLFVTLPSVDRLLGTGPIRALIGVHGRALVTDAVREVLADLRRRLSAEGEAAVDATAPRAIAERVAERVAARARPSLRRVFNLTGTVLHTNLGRAPLPDEAIAAIAEVGRRASNLEYDLEAGGRGERDDHIEGLIRDLTGAEAATVVNNNAAAVMLLLNSLALRKEVPVSRGELIEIGGAFRMPDIMARAGARLREVGTTNRTHLKDYAEAIGPRTALVMKVHASNYAIHGFTSAVGERDLAALAHGRGLPLVVDLGSGSLVDLEAFGLPHEPTVRETLAAGADLVTFSGDKLLGGPQAGLVVGRKDLVARLRRNPMKRAMRPGKTTLAALAAVLRLYADPASLAARLPALRLLARPAGEIRALAERLRPLLAERLAAGARVEVVACASQIGSGSLPVDRLPSAGLAIRPAGGKRGTGAALARLSAAFRALPVPVIGRVHEGALLFDLRCLEDEAAFAAGIAELRLD